jgi:Flp pilus assembly protein TadD
LHLSSLSIIRTLITRRSAPNFAPVLVSSFLLMSCQSVSEFVAENNLPSSRTSASVYESIPKEKINSETRLLVSQAVKALEENNLELASNLINRALKLDITNSQLQFLNGFIYHRQAEAGDTTKFDLADKGYELSVQFDPTNWIPVYQRGLLNLDRRKYPEAKKYFSQAAILNEREPGIFYNLAVVSYYALDPVTAAGALNKLRSLGQYGEDPKVLRASSIVMAALNKQDQAKGYFNKLQKVSARLSTPANSRQSDRLKGRLFDWNQFYQLHGKLELAQAVQVEQIDDVKVKEGDQLDAAKEQEPESNETKMIIVDVVIIRTEETITTRKGVNLLSGLTFQFGATDNGAFNYLKTEADLADTPGLTRTVIRAMTIPSITYSLNIANSNSTRNEILARPSLIALNGTESKFFSGVNINAAAIGTDGSTGATVGIKQDIGVTLTVSPEILDNGRVKLAVLAERTFLSTPNTTSITFTKRVDTSKTTVKANVSMKFGETLILSGLSEKETERKRDGVPGLQETPFLQYFFSQRDTSDFQKSVLILLTPRQTAYVHQSELNRKKALKNLSHEDRVLNELQSRYSDWFSPYPNWASIFNHLQNNSLYREFRTGDVALEKWENQEKQENRLKRILDFLYF